MNFTVEMVVGDCFWLHHSLPETRCLTCRSSAYQHAEVEGDGRRSVAGSQ